MHYFNVQCFIEASCLFYLLLLLFVEVLSELYFLAFLLYEFVNSYLTNSIIICVTTIATLLGNEAMKILLCCLVSCYSENIYVQVFCAFVIANVIGHLLLTTCVR